MDTGGQAVAVRGARRQVLDVTFDSRTAVVDVLASGGLPPTSTLVASLQGKVPKGVRVVVDGAEGKGGPTRERSRKGGRAAERRG